MSKMEVTNSSLIGVIDAWNLRDELLEGAIAIADRRLELLIEIYETDGVGLTSYILVKIEEELGDDYFNRHTT